MALIASPLEAQGAEGASDPIDAYLADLMADHRIPGIAMRVLTGQEVVHEHISGIDGTGQPIDTDTMFMVGSVAKPMTSTVVLGLVDQGRIGLDDTLGEHAPLLAANGGLPEPTIRQLLTHTSGYSERDGLRVSERYDTEPGAIARAAEELPRTGEPGQYAYSSANYLVLGAVIEEVTGQEYAAVLAEMVLRPLGMGDTAATAQDAAALPAGHRYWWDIPRRYERPLDNSGAPYGYVASTLNDLTHFARAQFDTGEGTAVVSEESLGQMHQHQVRTSSSGSGYGLGWRLTEIDGAAVVHHTGATPGFFAHVLTVPEEHKAVVVLINASSVAKSPAFGRVAFDLLALTGGMDLGEPPRANRMMASAPWLLAGGTVLLIAGALAGRRRPGGRFARMSLTVAAGLLAGGLTVAPSLLGYSHRILRELAPDIGWSITAGVVASAGMATSLAFSPRKRAMRDHD